jgi:phosphatidylserine/phosphatidylglycerophosphate/cardiolipin synthase-like enzyme
VEAGKRIGKYLAQAIELGRLCSNDPVCSQHRPGHACEERFLSGAACHGDLLLAETSCERRNEFLDRTLAKAYRKTDWPWDAVPERYDDPGSLAPNASERSVLHAKCIVADDRRAFVTSANFTEAAHERSIEAGLLLDNPTIALALTRQFEGLVNAKVLKRLYL